MQFYQQLCKEDHQGIILSAVERVWKSDTLVDGETLRELKDYVKILEDVPDKHKDWHPHSNDQVLNLIHPSLYPIIYSRSSILKTPIPSPQEALDIQQFGEFLGPITSWDVIYKYLDGPKDDALRCDLLYRSGNYMAKQMLSKKFCWLPTEFMVNEDGLATIDSYINNLHPIRHAKPYPVIAKVFSKFVPMLEQVVTDLAHLAKEKRVQPDYMDWYASDEPRPKTPDYPGEDGWWEEYDEKVEEWQEKRWFVDPQPTAFVAPDRPLQPYSLKGRRLLAIVKMSNIQLTPEKPEYEGGSWHVEAMANERIIATGIYYYDVENITESRLSFREPMDMLMSYEQGDRGGAEKAYGVANNEEMIQEVGHVVAEQGRCLVFPNIYQHQVSGFQLADPTKPGHRKILAFFFIDPSTVIPSTEYIPPQQQDWWAEKVMDISNNNALSVLPGLVKDNILKHVDFPMSLKEANKMRLELMEERSVEDGRESGRTFEPLCSLCEH